MTAILAIQRLSLLVLCSLLRCSCCDIVSRSTDPDGQVTVRVRFSNLTAVQTSFAGYDVLEVRRASAFSPDLDLSPLLVS